MANVIYRRALEEDLAPGRSIETAATASVYASARQVGNHRTIKEMYEVASEVLTDKQLARTCSREVVDEDAGMFIARYTNCGRSFEAADLQE